MLGIRGATTIAANSREAIFHGAQELLQKVMAANQLQPEDIVSLIFSATGDLTAAFPSAGIRALGDFSKVPLLDVQQMNVDGSLPMCLRLLLYTEKQGTEQEVKFVYLHGARVLRPDLVQ